MGTTHKQTNDFMFDYSNINTLPTKLAHFLGHSFIFDVIDKYKTIGLTSLQVKKLNKKFHPLCPYWPLMKQAINDSEREKVLKLNEQTIFLINLFFTLEQCKSVKNLELVINRLKKQKTFNSSCNELDVARYYIDLGYQVEAVPESKTKTPDFLVTTSENEKIYVEAKLIEDTKLQEDNQWSTLISKIDNLLIKHKKSLFIHIKALIPLKGIEQEGILRLIEKYCLELIHKGSCNAKNENVEIEISQICEWGKSHKDEVNLPDLGDLSTQTFTSQKLEDGFFMTNLRSINVTKFTKIDLIKSIRRNIEKANSQATANYPLIVHVGLPNKKSKEILDITDSVHEHFLGDISRNFEKINAVVIHASSLETNSKGVNPTREHRMIIPNFTHKFKLPESFKFGSYETLTQEELTSDGSIEIGYYPDSSLESLEKGAFGEMFFLCSNDAQVQIKLMLSSKKTMRLQLVSPNIKVRNFDVPMNASEFRNGDKLCFKWKDMLGSILIDNKLIKTINFG
jgi:hypothetical protein